MAKKVKQNKRIKQGKRVSEDESQIRTLIILLIIVVLVCVGIYFLTDTMIKRESKSNNSVQDVEINYDIATVGTMFNRIEDEYYVLLYSNEEDGTKLDSKLGTYRSSDDYMKTYYIDLDKKINKGVLGDKLEKEPKNSKEVKVNGATLYKIKEEKVIECISGVDEIIKVLEG